MTVQGVEGVNSPFGPPNALRVSVVGDFNRWDGQNLPDALLDSGIFELFIPGLKAGDRYKYEIKAKGGLTYLKADPLPNAAQMRPDTASVVRICGTMNGRIRNGCGPGEKSRGTRIPCLSMKCIWAPWQKAERGRKRILQLPGAGAAAGGICKGYGIYPCGADACNGASPG